jgi:peptide/nickel transport system substrate-binding protein
LEAYVPRREVLARQGFEGQPVVIELCATLAYAIANLLTSFPSPQWQQAALEPVLGAKAAGISIKLKVLQPGNYWTPAGSAYVRPFCLQVAQPVPSLTAAYRDLLQVGAPYWDTHWGAQQPGGKAANDLILAAEESVDTTKANELWRQVQQQQIDEGGYVVWGLAPYIIAANNVRGLKASSGLNFNNFRLQDGSIAT